MATITAEQRQQLLSLFVDRNFGTFIEVVETTVPEDRDLLDMVVYDILTDSSDDNIIDFVKYLEDHCIFTPTVHNGNNGETITDNSKLTSDNYDKPYFNPAQIIDGLVTIGKYDTADKLLVGEYALDEKTINMYIFMICDFSSAPDDLIGIDDAKQRAQWLVGRGDITWNDVPERLRPDFTGTFIRVGIFGDYLGSGNGWDNKEDVEEDNQENGKIVTHIEADKEQ